MPRLLTISAVDLRLLQILWLRKLAMRLGWSELGTSSPLSSCNAGWGGVGGGGGEKGRSGEGEKRAGFLSLLPFLPFISLSSPFLLFLSHCFSSLPFPSLSFPFFFFTFFPFLSFPLGKRDLSFFRHFCGKKGMSGFVHSSNHV